MESTGVQRKLITIFSADVQGYSRLMSVDEVGTIRTLTSHRNLVTTIIQEHRGRIVDSPGDNLLAVFESVADAVESAVKIQKQLKTINAKLPPERRMLFRIGINLGDVIVEGNRIYGDAVNITARLEGLADGGGICISGPVFAQVRNKLSVQYDFMGDQEVKNIPWQVRAYRIRLDPGGSARTGLQWLRLPSRSRRWSVAGLGAALVVGLAFWAMQSNLIPSGKKEAPRMSLVVLPLTNLSGDEDQDDFVDGITEDLITDLSRISGAFVISRNTSFTYRNKPVDVRQVAAELGVRYVLEGSVRRAGHQVRMNAQLIDAGTGSHIWSDRFDVELGDLFTLQIEITGRIARALNLQLIEAESRRARNRRPANVEAMDYVMRGWAALSNKPPSPENNAEAKRYLEQALALNAESAQAWAGMAYVHFRNSVGASGTDQSESKKLALQAAERAIQLDPKSAEAHYVLGLSLRANGQLEKSIAAMEKCIALNPNYAPAYHGVAWGFIFSGRAGESPSWIEKALRLSPKDPLLHIWESTYALVWLLLGEYEKAGDWAKKAIASNPKWPTPYIWLAATEALLGRDAKAKEALTELLKLRPNLTISRVSNQFQSGNETFLKQRERFIHGLRKAGLPE